MAIEWLVTGVFGLLGTIFQGVFAVVGSALGGIGGGGMSGGIMVGAAWLNTFLPVGEVVAGIASLLGLFVFLFGYRFLREHWGLVPFVGGHT